MDHAQSIYQKIEREILESRFAQAEKLFSSGRKLASLREELSRSIRALCEENNSLLKSLLLEFVSGLGDKTLADFLYKQHCVHVALDLGRPTKQLPGEFAHAAKTLQLFSDRNFVGSAFFTGFMEACENAFCLRAAQSDLEGLVYPSFKTRFRQLLSFRSSSDAPQRFKNRLEVSEQIKLTTLLLSATLKTLYTHLAFEEAQVCDVLDFEPIAVKLILRKNYVFLPNLALAGQDSLKDLSHNWRRARDSYSSFSPLRKSLRQGPYFFRNDSPQDSVCVTKLLSQLLAVLNDTATPLPYRLANFCHLFPYLVWKETQKSSFGPEFETELTRLVVGGLEPDVAELMLLVDDAGLMASNKWLAHMVEHLNHALFASSKKPVSSSK